MARRKGGSHGGHGWFVTFADLMGLLLSFFVVVVASSTQEKEKMLAIAGSFREAFGTVEYNRQAGIIEIDGVPTRNATKNVGQDIEKAGDITAPKDADAKNEKASTARSGVGGQALIRTEMAVRQALQSQPDLAELASQIIFEERPDGFAIEIVDQDGRSMFPNGSTQPTARIEKALSIVGRELQALPNKISITGHTASREPQGDYLLERGWQLSTQRALEAREILASNGIASARFRDIGGRADTDPFFPDDPSRAANRRITLLLHEAASVLPDSTRP